MLNGTNGMTYWEWIYRTMWIALGVLAAIGILCLFGPRISRYEDFRQRETELREEIRMEEEIIKHLRLQQQRLQADPRFLERLAHEQGLARTNEVLFQVPEGEP